MAQIFFGLHVWPHADFIFTRTRATARGPAKIEAARRSAHRAAHGASTTPHHLRRGASPHEVMKNLAL